MTLLREWYGECHDPGHDKAYQILVEDQGGGAYTTTAWWGKTGNLKSNQVKYNGPSETAAVSTAIDLARDKKNGSPGHRYPDMAEVNLARGGVAARASANPVNVGPKSQYTPPQAAPQPKPRSLSPSASTSPSPNQIANMGYQEPAQVPASEPALTPQYPKQLTSRAAFEYVLDNQEHVAEVKENGERLTVTVIAGVAVGGNKLGQIRQVPSLVAAELVAKSPPGATVYDGEQVGPQYRVWQVLGWDGVDMRNQPYIARHQRVPQFSSQAVANVISYMGPAAKRGLLAFVEKNRLEGIVLKLGYAVSAVGESDSWLKWKLEADADVVFGDFKAGKSSIEMFLHDANGKAVSVGFVTVPPNKAAWVAPGVVAPITYLYAINGSNQLYQQRISVACTGPRTDKRPEACLLTQLKYQGKEAERDAAPQLV